MMHFIKLPKTFKNKLGNSEPLIEVTLSLQVSFHTSGQVKYVDGNGRPRIIEFVGSSWSIDLLLSKATEIQFSTFVVNNKKLENQFVILMKKVNNSIVEKKKFEISTVNNFDGWFKID